MVQFQTAYQSAMDRGYYAPASPYAGVEGGNPDIEGPLVPLNELGETVVEKDPRTGANIIQTVTAAVRAGAGSIQIVMSVPPEQAIGGRAKAYGREVREAVRELAEANEVHITGVELPTAISNLSGYNQQTGYITDETRHTAMTEVRDAIKFVADVAGGGGVDIFSVEYPRTMFDSKWNRKIGEDRFGRPVYQFQAYPEEPEKAVKHLVDDRTGRVLQEIRMNQVINYPIWKRYKGDKKYTDENGNTVNPGDYIGWDNEKLEREQRIPEYDADKNEFKVERKTWKYFEKEAAELNEEKAKESGVPVHRLKEQDIITPQEAFLRASNESQERIARGWEIYYGRMIENIETKRTRLKEAIKFYKNLDENLPEEEKYKIMREDPRAHDFLNQMGLAGPQFKKIPDILEDQMKETMLQIEQSQASMLGQRQTAEDYKFQREHIVSAEKYAKQKSYESYAEAGISALDETQFNKNVKRPIYVGPEIGWPQGYGAHPDEFVELIKTSRDIMKERLINERGYKEREAEQAAKTHIKGLFDTSHMGMWLNNFRRLPGESDEKRLKEFNNWYMDKVKEIAKADVIGQIQAVDSATGAHGHLPAGQGIFPVVEAVKEFKKSGFKGPVVSEGHEEEQFGQNRILLETWKAFGAGTYRSGGGGPAPGRWNRVQDAYFGRTYPPYFVFGGYAPSNEWTLWSQTPFE